MAGRVVRKRKPKKCEMKNCKNKATMTIPHFDLTGEYLNRRHFFCKHCLDLIIFNKEVRRQRRELTADEDELISGDFEE